MSYFFHDPERIFVPPPPLLQCTSSTELVFRDGHTGHRTTSLCRHHRAKSKLFSALLLLFILLLLTLLFLTIPPAWSVMCCGASTVLLSWWEKVCAGRFHWAEQQLDVMSLFDSCHWEHQTGGVCSIRAVYIVRLNVKWLLLFLPDVSCKNPLTQVCSQTPCVIFPTGELKWYNTHTHTSHTDTPWCCVL